MGAWGVGMQASDDAWDTIARYEKFEDEDSTTNFNKVPTKLFKDLQSGKKSILKEFQFLSKDRCDYYGDMGLLAAAEYLLEAKVNLKPAMKIIKASIRYELTKDRIESWKDRKERRDALLRFRNRLDGKRVNKKKLALDNEGLFSKMDKAFSR